jgi:hypothetical protein
VDVSRGLEIWGWDRMLTGCAGHHGRWGAAISARNALRVVVVDDLAGVAADTRSGTGEG